MLSLFLVLARPSREEAKQRSGIPEWVSLPRPEVRGTYTRIWRRRTERGGCAFRTPSLRVNYAARARLLLLAAIFFHLFNEVGETSACNLSRARPRRSRFAPMGISRDFAQRSGSIVTLGPRRYSPFGYSGFGDRCSVGPRKPNTEYRTPEIPCRLDRPSTAP